MDTADRYARLQATMQDYAGWVRSSAERMLPFAGVAGRSVVDFGCGQGDWLVAALALGAREVLGLDTYAAEDAALPVPARWVDLTQPVALDRRYDVALCLEVGEHLEAAFAATLVASLVAAAPVVLFSAAAPGQGGVRHVNEQPPAYWSGLFGAHGYRCHDIRRAIWDDARIEPWYRMGAMVFTAQDVPALDAYRVEAPLHLVHPDIFAAYAPRGQDVILHYDRAAGRWHPEMLG